MSTLTSSPSATVAVTATAAGWWLKNPTNPALNMQVNVQDKPKTSQVEQAGVHYPLGRSRPLITTDVVTGHDGAFTALTLTPAQYAGLEALKAAQTTLLLQSPFGEQWYVRLTGERASVLTRSTLAAPYRDTTFTYVEVDPPA